VKDLTVEQLVADAPESGPFWEGMAAGSLRLQRCAGCGRLRCPPLTTCPYCGSPEAKWEEVEARGTLYSWVVSHFAFADWLGDDVPYTIGTVVLEGGPKLFARITGLDAAGLRAGMPLEGYFHQEGALPFVRFRPRAADGD
jgi:uncharacterized OB-fold protein